MPTASNSAANSEGLRLVACPHPFSVDRIDRQVTAGGYITDILQEAGIDPDIIFARVFIGDVLVPKTHWRIVRPKAGQILTVRVIPTGGGGGGKDVLRIVALIAIVAVAIFAPYYAPAAWGLTTVGAGGGLVLTSTGALVSAAISIAGTLAISAMIPPPRSRRHGVPDVFGCSEDIHRIKDIPDVFPWGEDIHRIKDIPHAPCMAE